MKSYRTAAAFVAAGLVALGIVHLSNSAASADTQVDTERSVSQAIEQGDAAGLALADRAYFNDPQGTAAQQYAIRDHINSLIQNAAVGSTINAAVYNIRDAAVSNALVAAKNRGVGVRVIVDSQSAADPATVILRNGLGTNRGAASWLHVCTAEKACIGNAGTPIMHNKFYLFSSTGGSANVVVQSSANQNLSNSTKFFNNALQLVGNAGLYREYLNYFDDLAEMKKNNDYYRTANSGNAKVYFFPRAGTTKSSDTIYNALNENITCPGNTTAGTSGGNTIIRVAMWSFTRQAIADELRQLADKKCWIQVIYTEADAGVLQALSGHSRIGLFKLRKTDSAGDESLIVHSKYMAIEGTYAGVKNTRLVFTGSHNYTNSALRENDEAMIKLTSAPIHDAYWSNFVKMRTAAGG